MQKKQYKSPKPRFPIGTQFISRSNMKIKRVETVTGYIDEINRESGEFLKRRYVATHEFMGQTMKNTDLCETNVAMGIENLKQLRVNGKIPWTEA